MVKVVIDPIGVIFFKCNFYCILIVLSQAKHDTGLDLGEDWEWPDNIKMPSSNKQPYFIERAKSFNRIFTVCLKG
jgi:hypothetical protein